jgi:hypothetical protein
MQEMNMADRDKGGLSGRDLQESQSGGESGRFGGNMEQQQGDGSSGTSGYGNSLDTQSQHEGGGGPGSGGLSRGEAFDEQQGGGRGPDSVSDLGESADDLELDQQAEDRARSEAERESE